MSAPVKVAGPAEQRVDDDLGHRVAGGDQAVHPAGRRRALADRPDVLVGGAALLVDEDAAALGEVEAGRAGQRVARPDAGGEDDDLGVDRVCVLAAPSPADPPVVAEHLARSSRRCARSGRAPRCAGRSVAPPASSTCTAISRGAISTTWVSRPSWSSAFAASSPSRPPPMTAPTVAPAGGLADRLEVLDGAVDEAAGQVVARHRRHERRGAGGEHQLVVVQDLAVVEQRRSASRGSRPRDLGAEDAADPRVVVLARRAAATAPRRRPRRTRSARPGRTPGAAPRRRRRCRRSR